MEHCLLVLAWLRNDFFDVLLYVQQERERPIVRQVRRGPVAVSRTNSAAKQIELKIGAFPMSVFVDAGSKAHLAIQLSSDIDGHEAGRQEILVRSLRCAERRCFTKLAGAG